MFKQILNKLPRKSPKASEHGGNGNHVVYPKQGNSSASHAHHSDLEPMGHHHHHHNHHHYHDNNTAPFPNGDLAFLYSEALPAFRDVPNSEKQYLLVKKLKMCSVVFDFTDPSKHLKEKEVKRQALMELVDRVTTATAMFSEPVILEVVKMVSANIFRTLSPQPRDNNTIDGLDLEEDEPAMDAAWPHLQIVYELFLKFVASPELEAKLAKRYINQSFISKLLDLFDSEDPREREYLKMTLHRIYGKFMVHRPFIRKSINNIFFSLVFETAKHNGIAELLEILGSIINGFALPLKDEHKLFLVRALIPLHKPKCLATYHQQLSYCIVQFVEKDCKLADTIIRGLLKSWPIINSSKEVMYLGELEEVLEITQPPEFQRCMVPLFRRIALCLNSPHFQVAERALFLWNSDHIQSLIKQHRKVILPIIFPALEKNIRNHWNQAVHIMTLNVRKIFNDLDPELFKECLQDFEKQKSEQDEKAAKRAANWTRLENLAAKKTANSEAVLIP